MKKKYTIQESIDLMGCEDFTRNQYQMLYVNYETQICKKGYLQYRLTETDRWKNVHSLVNIYYNKEEHDAKYKELVETGIEICLVTHHKAFEQVDNKLNNHPDNLQWMGRQEHMEFHISFINILNDKLWNKSNADYENYEQSRQKIINNEALNKYNTEYWYGPNGEENRKNKSKHMQKIALDFWSGDTDSIIKETRRESIRKNFEKYREKNIETLYELWNGDTGKEYRNQRSEEMRIVMTENWHGENGAQYKQHHKNCLNELWHGEGSEEFRKNFSEKMKTLAKDNIKHKQKLSELNKNVELTRKKLESRVFNIFNKIIENKENINIITYKKYKLQGSPFPETVFGSIENAIDKYQDYPKRVKLIN